jgi:hypothetical protein
VGCNLCGEIAAGTRPVVNDDLLGPGLCEPLAEHARNDVITAAGRERNDEAYRLDGILLRVQRDPGRAQGAANEHFHFTTAGGP